MTRYLAKKVVGLALGGAVSELEQQQQDLQKELVGLETEDDRGQRAEAVRQQILQLNQDAQQLSRQLSQS